MSYAETPGTKMIYLIKRRPTTSREELVMHWFANHMPKVIQAQKDAAAAGRAHARRYVALLFDADADGEHAWDGMAELWWDEPLRRPRTAHGARPTDSFQEKAEPYVPWATREYVVIDGSERLSTAPLTLNAPYPSTRSGFYRRSFLVAVRPGTDFGAFFDHWLGVHVPNVAATMDAVGGFRYVVSHSLEPDREPYAGLAELYFDDKSGWERYRTAIESDGMEQWVDAERMLVLSGTTEMIGIP